MDQVVTIKGSTALRKSIQANAKRTTFAGFHHGRLKMTVAAPPVDGKANNAILAYLAGFFGLQKSEVQLVGGQPSCQKTCILAHLKEEEVREKLMDFAGCQPPTGSMP